MSEYDLEFARYLRYGMPLRVPHPEGKEESIPEVYIWRIRDDDKVRSSHSENNSKIFTRHNPPPTGHPGEEHGCRCVAEPYTHGKTEYASQTDIIP